MYHILECLRRPVLLAAAFALLLSPNVALAQFEEEGLGIGEGLYDEEGIGADNWFYDSYGGNFPGGYGNYGEAGFGEEEEEADYGATRITAAITKRARSRRRTAGSDLARILNANPDRKEIEMNRFLAPSAVLALILAGAPAVAQQSSQQGNSQQGQVPQQRQPSVDQPQGQTGQQLGGQQAQPSGRPQGVPPHQYGIRQFDLPRPGTLQSLGGGGQRQDQDQRRLSGRVLLLKEVQQRNSNDPHGVVLMQTRNGRTILADLGPVSGLRTVPVRQNDVITVSGFPGRVGNRLVFFATDVQAGNARAQIQRPGVSKQEQVRPEYRQVRGNIVRSRQVKVRGMSQPNVLALVQTQGGQRVLVDLGSAQAMRANLQNGQPITVRGREVRLGDRVLLLANQFRTGDQSYDVNRPAYLRNRG